MQVQMMHLLKIYIYIYVYETILERVIFFAWFTDPVLSSMKISITITCGLHEVSWRKGQRKNKNQLMQNAVEQKVKYYNWETINSLHKFVDLYLKIQLMLKYFKMRVKRWNSQMHLWDALCPMVLQTLLCLTKG